MGGPTPHPSPGGAPQKAKATLQFPDGTAKTIKVRDDVDLTKAAVGEDVVIRASEALAISVEKP